MSQPATFLDGVAEHLRAFATAKGVRPDRVYLRFTLADGTHALARGLNVDGPAGTYAWGAIQGLIKGTADALLIREDHVVSVEFQVEPMVPGPAGLHAEELPTA